MSNGYHYRCQKCSCKYKAYPGFGMLYPIEYAEKMHDIASGKYGIKWKELIEGVKYAAIDAADVIYVCDRCNRWEQGTNITLYSSNGSNIISEEQYNAFSKQEWDSVPFTTNLDLRINYHVIKRYYHKCKVCGKRMHIASDDELMNLPCPKCGSTNEVEDILRWD